MNVIVGRTGRFGRSGTSTSFLTYQCSIAKPLKKLLKKMKQPVPVELEDTKAFGADITKTQFGDKPRNM